jgi:hypothetical protein
MRWIAQRLRSAWSAHRRLIDTNAAYGAALAAGAASIVGQISLERLLVAFLSACLAIYVAVRGRGLAWAHRSGGFGADRDDWDDDENRDVRLLHDPRWSDS